LEWDDAKMTFVRVQCETFGKTGIRRATPGLYMAADPKGRSIMIGAVERAKFVYILNRDPQTNKLVISSPLDSHKNHIVCFGIVGVDVGFDNPIYASIEVDYSESDNDATGKAFQDIEKVN
jgi:splicing factor 3B subunit 3